MSGSDDLSRRARTLHDEGLFSADGLARFLDALQKDEATPSEYATFLDHIEARRGAEPGSARLGAFDDAELEVLIAGLQTDGHGGTLGDVGARVRAEFEAERTRRAGA